MKAITTKSFVAMLLMAMAVGLPAGDAVQAGKRGKRGKRSGKVVVPGWVKGLVTKDTPVRGAVKPDLVVVEFSDYECPFCALAHTKMLKVLKKYGKRIRFYYRHYPLDNTCNKTMRRQMHPKACLASKAAICAQAQGRFWAFHHKLYGLGQRLSSVSIMGLVKTLRLKRSKFIRCLNSASTNKILQRDIKAGNQARLQGTPTFYAGGAHIKRFTFSSPAMKTFDKAFALIDKQRKKKKRRRR